VVDPRLAAAPEVEALAGALEGTVVGLYVGGSLATGDYVPGVSDIDAVALVERAPRPAVRKQLVGAHEDLVRRHTNGGSVHCVYVALDDSTDPDRTHWTWAFGELFRRPLSRIARAELLHDPVVVFGPPPSTWLPPLSQGDLRDAARAELAGYWTRALRKRAIWRQDVYVDLGLTVWARAEATITEGRLITKSEAITRLRGRGVPDELVDQMARRRAGETVRLTDEQREARAVVVRRFLRVEVARLTAPGSSSSGSPRSSGS
jgi:predicted nucleotidyltransferase